MIITSPEISDFPKMVAIYNQAIAPFYNVYNFEEQEVFADQRFETADALHEDCKERNILCVKKTNKDVVGYVTYRHKNNVVYWISSLYIDVLQQGQGFGKALLREVENRATLGKAKIVALETHIKATWAIGFYLKNGYNIVNDIMHETPYNFILDRPPVTGRIVFAKLIERNL